MKKHILIILFTGLFAGVYSQQLPLYNQYLLNSYLINPALAGSDGYTTLNLTARTQWLGMPGAPNNQIFSYQTRLLKRSFIIKRNSPNRKKLKPSRSGRVGLGGYVFNDTRGGISRTGMHMSYAYHIHLRESQLSFGLGATGYQYHIRELDFTEDEPLINENELYSPIFVADADFGLSYLHRNYHFGFSVQNLIQSNLRMGNSTLDAFKLYRTFYLKGGYVFDLNNRFMLEPSAMTRFAFKTRNRRVGVPAEENKLALPSPQLDLNLKLYFSEYVWAGVSGRTTFTPEKLNETIITIFGVNLDKYQLAYAFEMGLDNLSWNSYGTHEFMLAIKLGDSARRFRWVDRY